MAIAQPVLIGRYLDGDFDRLGAHRTNGSVLPAIVLLCLGGALCHWLIGRGQLWPVPATALLLPIEGMQIGAGHAHNLAVHIPLGTSIVALAVFLAAWSWTPRVHQVRVHQFGVHQLWARRAGTAAEAAPDRVPAGAGPSAKLSRIQGFPGRLR
jgi:hypothetical protein